MLSSLWTFWLLKCRAQSRGATVQGLLCYAELCGSLPCCAVRLRCAEISNETIAGKSATERNIHHGEGTFCTSVGTYMAMTHRSNAFFAHAWGFGTPGPVLRLRFRVWPHSRGRPRWALAHKGAAMPSALARACAGKADGREAQRVALQIAFSGWVGPNQKPEYLEWLLSELMK
jgi:hypothetical protein